MWFWPRPSDGEFSTISSAELPIVIAIGAAVFFGAIVYWIHENDDSPGIYVFRFFWKLFLLVGLPALSILNWNFNTSNKNLASLVFASALTVVAALGFIGAILGNWFSRSKPAASASFKNFQLLITTLTLFFAFSISAGLALVENVYLALSSIAAVYWFRASRNVRLKVANVSLAEVYVRGRPLTWLLIFSTLTVGAFLNLVLRIFLGGSVWQTVGFWMIFVAELAIVGMLLLATFYQDPTDKSDAENAR